MTTRTEDGRTEDGRTEDGRTEDGRTEDGRTEDGRTGRFAPGDRVRTRSVDPDGHTRLPRYARGAVGVVVEPAGAHPLADERARGLAGPAQTVYHVRFPAADLFGAGDHTVTVELWEDYLIPVEKDS